MGFSEDIEFRTAYKYWAEQMDYYQYQIFIETFKIVDLLKHKKVSAKTKNEIIIVIKGLWATTKSVSRVLSKYVG